MMDPTKKSRLMAEINITPFTDVVLVLLIIFMVTTPLIMQTGLTVKLPKAATQELQPTEENPLKIALQADGQILLNEVPVSREDLTAALKNRLTQNKNTLVVLQADERVLHGSVVDILDLAKQEGAQRLAIATQAKMPDKLKIEK